MKRREDRIYEKYNEYELYKAFSDSPKSLRRNQVKILSQLNLIKEHEVAASILKYIRENEKLVSKNIADDDIKILEEIINKWNKLCEVAPMEEINEKQKRKYSNEQVKALLEAYSKGLTRDECLKEAGFTTLTQKEKTFYYNTIQRYRDNKIPKYLCPDTETKTEEITETPVNKDTKQEVVVDTDTEVNTKAHDIKEESSEEVFKSPEPSDVPIEEKVSVNEVISKAKGKIEKLSAEITAIEMKIQTLRKKEIELEDEQKRLLGITEFCEEVQKSIMKEAEEHEREKGTNN